MKNLLDRTKKFIKSILLIEFEAICIIAVIVFKCLLLTVCSSALQLALTVQQIEVLKIENFVNEPSGSTMDVECQFLFELFIVHFDIMSVF